MVEKRPALGRGLSALIPDVPDQPAASARPLEVDTDLLTPNRFEPRTTMDDGRIEELARSIRSNGIIQPIVVRKHESGYEIIAGERRWRASQRAGLLKVPIVVRDIPDDRLLAAALIENLQREDLNPMEEAHAYRRLADEFHLTQEQIADAVGKDRSSVANVIRLLRLPLEVRENVAAGTIAMGHARALLSLPDEAAQLRMGSRGRVETALGSRDRGARQESDRARDTARVAAERRAHARRRGPSPLRARHTRPHRAKSKGGTNRSRLHIGRGASAHLRPDGGEKIDRAKSWQFRPLNGINKRFACAAHP